jgi:acyl carrier protein
MSDDFDSRIRSVLSEVFDLQPDDVGAETSFDTVEGWDSLQHLTLVLALEEEFGIHFDDEETLELISYPLITTIVSERVGTAERS